MKTSIDVSVEVEIARPLSTVWTYVSDLERIPEWISEIERVQLDPQYRPGLGAIAHYTIEGGRSGTMEVVDWAPPNRLAWDGPPLSWAGGGARPRGSHTLTELGEVRTLLVTRYEPELSGTQVFLPVSDALVATPAAGDAQTLKAVLERSESP